MWPQRGPSGADMTQVGPMLAPWTFLSGLLPFGQRIVKAVRCRYNAVHFLPNTHNIHPIARPLGRSMGVFHVGSNSHLYPASVTAVVCAITCQNGSRYNDTLLYLTPFYFNTIALKYTISWQISVMQLTLIWQTNLYRGCYCSGFSLVKSVSAVVLISLEGNELRKVQEHYIFKITQHMKAK